MSDKENESKNELDSQKKIEPEQESTGQPSEQLSTEHEATEPNTAQQHTEAASEQPVSDAAPDSPLQETAMMDSEPTVAPVSSSSSTSTKVWIGVSLVLAVVLIVVLVRPPFGGIAGSETVASVNGVNIGKDKLYDALVDAGGKQTLDNLITVELINQEADQAGVTVTDEDLNKELEDFKKNFSSEEEFNQVLSQYGMTVDDLKKEMNTQVKIRKILEPSITIADEDIKSYFDQNKATFDTAEQVRASHILVETEEEANAALKRVKGGEDFAAVAQELSTDTYSAMNGGDLDYFERGVMDEAFEKAAFSLQVNEISDVVKSTHGYHIIKVTDHKEAYTATLEDKKEEIKETLVTQELSTKSSSWLEEVRSKADIKNTLEDAEATESTETTTSAK